ncbi:MAG: division/cell wall cluster transcriptional repressor MraZ [Planctomycetota bacterium]
MISFLGTSTHTLDEKGRLIVPKRFMDEIPPKDAKFTITASLDGCLLLLDQASWEEAVAQFSRDVFVDSATRAVRRVFLGHADVVEPDRNNRVLINESLRAFAGLQPNAEVVLVGAGKSIEIWHPQQWGGALTQARQLHEFFDTPIGRSAETPAAS